MSEYAPRRSDNHTSAWMNTLVFLLRLDELATPPKTSSGRWEDNVGKKKKKKHTQKKNSLAAKFVLLCVHGKDVKFITVYAEEKDATSWGSSRIL